jgi:23S rRNA pseudouridine1911/1915/1917 synthase
MAEDGPPRHGTATRHVFHVGPEDAGKRLDQALAAHVPGLSRRRARVLLELGGVFVDGARTKVAGRLVRRGQRVEAHLGGAFARAQTTLGSEARAEDEAKLPAPRIVFVDDALVVVDKPAGLLAAPTPESDRGNLVSILSRQLGSAVHLVHRIDLETSGLLVFARTEEVNAALAAIFQVHAVERVYQSVWEGAIVWDELTIEAPVAGKRAVTHVRVKERLSWGATRVECRLETGRTHQIRIHAASVGHPLLGDKRYGQATAHDPPRTALHAAVLGFVHPKTGEPVRFESPWPEDLASWLEGRAALSV